LFVLSFNDHGKEALKVLKHLPCLDKSLLMKEEEAMHRWQYSRDSEKLATLEI
jgi:hypothetical protein